MLSVIQPGDNASDGIVHPGRTGHDSGTERIFLFADSLSVSPVGGSFLSGVTLAEQVLRQSSLEPNE